MGLMEATAEVSVMMGSVSVGFGRSVYRKGFRKARAVERARRSSFALGWDSMCAVDHWMSGEVHKMCLPLCWGS